MFERERERERKGEREEERKGLNCSPAKSNLSFLDTGYNQILSDSVLIHLGLKSNLSHFQPLLAPSLGLHRTAAFLQCTKSGRASALKLI